MCQVYVYSKEVPCPKRFSTLGTIESPTVPREMLFGLVEPVEGRGKGGAHRVDIVGVCVCRERIRGGGDGRG